MRLDPVTRRFALRIGLPAVLILIATIATVLVSLDRMASDVNSVETRLTERSATAAVQSTLRRFGETAHDYAEWDDAVANLYGQVNLDWAKSNIFASTGDAILFDTVYLVDDKGTGIVGYRDGKPVSATSAEAFGPSLASMIAALPQDGRTFGVKEGIVKGAWGLAIVAAAPVVPQSSSSPSAPQPVRFLVISKSFDDGLAEHLREDFLIKGLHLTAPAAANPQQINLVDPDGTIVGALGWAPRQVGSLAQERVNPLVVTMLLLIGALIVFLGVAALRGWKAVRRSEVQLDTALQNMAVGLCMFDPSRRLVTFNRRFLEIFNIAPDKVRPGLPMSEVMQLAQALDRDPETARASQQGLIDGRSAGAFTTTLADGRIISIADRPMAGGGFVATYEDITERQRVEERIRYLAHHDALTGLPNRVLFHERMKSGLHRLPRAKTVAILSLDIDDFKGVNDTLGHPVGDLLLQMVADRMRACVRDEDTIARLGGDEFAILQSPSDDTTDTAALASRLVEVVGAPYDLDGHQVVVGTSIGIAVAPADGHDPDALMKNADLALYRAKADGGNVYRFFEIAMDARMRARRALELDLRKAVVNAEFELLYQPILTVGTRDIRSCEALVRWHHPERGLVMPAEFIPVAEQTGLIVPLGEWVLRQACAEAARWPQNVTVAVNLSPAQFKSRNLLPTIVNALAASGLPAKRLQLEITELVLLQDDEGAFAILHQLQGLGVSIAMDDFGTGYSSLGYLRRFPFNKIKIDQAFVRDLPTNEDSVAIVRAVVGLSSSLGITTTAEGVETEAQLVSLTSEGCGEVQGYLFSMPRPAADIERMLADAAPAGTAVA